MKNNNFNIGDVVRIKKGIYKGQLGLITEHIGQFLSHKVKVIANGVEMVYKDNTLLFCYKNDKESIKFWEDIIKHNQEEMIKNYSNIKYIKYNFDEDIFICNNVVINTIVKAANININYDAFKWFYDNKTALSVIFYYDRPSFVLEYCRLIDKTISKEEILRLHKAAWS